MQSERQKLIAMERGREINFPEPVHCEPEPIEYVTPKDLLSMVVDEAAMADMLDEALSRRDSYKAMLFNAVRDNRIASAGLIVKIALYEQAALDAKRINDWREANS